MRSESGLVEADVAVDGVQLNFAQSMALRVAVGSFLMCVEFDDALGAIAPLYADRCREILKILHGDIKRQR